MIIITNQGNSIKIEGLVPNSYFPDGTLNAPKNSLIAVIEGDIVSFKGSTNFNTLFATTLGELTINGVQADSENIDSLLNSTIYKINSGGGGTGGTEYFAGQNIDISEENVISVVGINVPDKTSDLTNDSGFITSADVHTYSAGTNISIVEDVISVTGLSIPNKTSDLTNDSGFITSGDVHTYSAGTNISIVEDVISVSGVPTDFKTINGQSITGSGNIVIEGGTGGTEYIAGTNIDITNNVISVTGITEPTKTSELENDSGFITSADIHTYSAGTNISIVDDVISVTGLTIPDKTSDLTNDSGYITSSDIPSIPEKVSDLQNDVGFITSADVPEYSGSTNINVDNHVISLTGVPTEFKTINNQSITGNGNITIESTAYSGGTNIDITDHVISVTGLSIPTKTSDLTNDSGFITSADVPQYSGGTNISIVDDVISVTGLTIPDKTSDLTNDSGYITSSDIPSIPEKVSDLQNDEGFITSADVHTYSAGTNISIVEDVISVSGVVTEFKTINNQSITGSGNITVESTAYSGGTNIDITDHVISVTGINVPTSASQLTNDAGYVSTVLLTQSQYDALSTAEKNDATKLYIITDAASPAFIDDTLVSSGSTYSSQKIETILGDIETALSNI